MSVSPHANRPPQFRKVTQAFLPVLSRQTSEQPECLYHLRKLARAEWLTLFTGTVKRTVSLILLLLIVLALWTLVSRLAKRTAVAPEPPPGGSALSFASASRSPRAVAEAASGATAERSTLADELNTPTSDIQRDLRLVSEIIGTFQTNFLRTGNPTGTNAEITAALAGKNPLRLALVPADHPAINQEGELVDRWGTPFFFHAESATRMEIRSAGPDRKMWTEDDVAFVP